MIFKADSLLLITKLYMFCQNIMVGQFLKGQGNSYNRNAASLMGLLCPPNLAPGLPSA